MVDQPPRVLDLRDRMKFIKPFTRKRQLKSRYQPIMHHHSITHRSQKSTLHAAESQAESLHARVYTNVTAVTPTQARPLTVGAGSAHRRRTLNLTHMKNYLTNNKRERLQHHHHHHRSPTTSKYLMDLETKERKIARSLHSCAHGTKPQEIADIVESAAKRLSASGGNRLLLDQWKAVEQDRLRAEKVAAVKKTKQGVRTYRFLKVKQQMQYNKQVDAVVLRYDQKKRATQRRAALVVKQKLLRSQHHRVPTKISAKNNGLKDLSEASKRIFGRF